MRLAALLLSGVLAGFVPRTQEADDVRFAVVEVRVDSGGVELAAWQVELVDPTGRATVVGVEGGAEPWSEPPRYDPAALRGGRIVLAAFLLEGARAGEQQVARVHLAIEGGAPVALDRELVVAAAPGGDPVEGARLEVSEG